MIIIFSNNPFDDEVRLECKMIKMKTRAQGEICILDNYFNSIFDINDTCIETTPQDNNGKIEKIKIIGNGIVEIKNNVVKCFGQFERL